MKIKCPKHGTEFDPVKGEGCPECLAEKKEAISQSPLVQAIVDADPDIEVTVNTIPEEPEDSPFTKFANTASVAIWPEKNPDVTALLEKVNTAVKNADAFVVDGTPAVEQATTYLADITAVQKAVEEKRVEYVGPLNAHVNDINTHFKLYSEPIGQAVKTLKGKIIHCQQEAAKKQAEAEAIIREKEELERRTAELENRPVEKLSVTETAMPLPVKTHHETEAGTSTLVANWKAEVVDFTALPDDYKLVDMVTLTSLAKKHHGTKVIPGVRFFNEPGLRVGK